MRLLHTIIIASLCSLIALAVFAYKWKILEFPLEPNQEAESWHIEAKAEFQSQGKPVKLQLYLPKSGHDYSIVDENFISEGYGFSTETEEDTGNRVAKWARRKPYGREVIFYRAILYQATQAEEESATKAPKIRVPVFGSQEFFERSENDPVYVALSDLITGLREHSADDETLMVELFKTLGKGKDERLTRLQADTDAKTPAALAALVLNHASIPAKVMHGIKLDEDQRNARFLEWVSVFSEGHWQPIDMQTGTIGVPYKLLSWWEGAEKAYALTGGARPSLTISVRRQVESALKEAIWKGNHLTQAVYDLSVFSLPVDVQLVFRILLLVPIGALVAAFLRQVIGLPTFGTFMPVLVALAFRETQLLWGIILFCAIVGTGLIFRSYFDRLQLLLVPRLTAVLTVVVLIIFGITLVTFNMGIPAGLSVSLFPMVIMTMVIERMSLTWEEFGAKQALQQGGGSLLVAALCYLVMNDPLIQHLIITFPELLLVVLAASLMLGRYNGYKLFEYYRFRALAKVA